jgi:hypothetical protein
MSAPAPDNHATVARLSDLHALLDQYVSAPTRHDDLDLVLAAVYAVHLGTEDGRPPFWLLFVDPPASGKTAIVMSVRPATDRVVFLDALTAESFMSGAVSKQGAKAAKLLPQLHHKCLVVKDLTTLFSMKHDLVRKILGDLQSIYDGEYSKAIGTGFDGKAVIESQSYFGFVGCITPAALQGHQRYLANIGTRFLIYQRPPMTSADRARGYELQNQADRAALKTVLQEKACEHVKALFEEKPRATLPRAVDLYLRTLSEYVRLGRTPVFKDEDGGRVLGVAEEPFRVYQQLRLAVEALAVVRGHAEVMAADVDVVRRLALSSILHRRYEAMRALQQAPDQTLTPALAGEAMRLGDDQTRTWLKDLVDVGLLQKDGEGRYVSAPPFAGILRGDGPE